MGNRSLFPALLEVALCELTYYHRWLNISAELGNGNFDGRTVLGIPKGYYNVCELEKEAFRLWMLNSVCMSQPAACRFPQKKKKKKKKKKKTKKRLVLNRELADLLGFSREMFEPDQSHIADKPHRLFTHREICVHLAEVSTSENLHNGRPSTLLKSIPVENERCVGGGGGGWGRVVQRHSPSCSTNGWHRGLFPS